MPDTCTGSERCSATVAEHQRDSATAIVLLSKLYDSRVSLSPSQLAGVDQAAARYRSVLVLQGVDVRSRDSVGILAVASGTQLAIMSRLVPSGSVIAAAAAKMLVLSMPLLMEMADG